jgi:phosphate transport system protein
MFKNFLALWKGKDFLNQILEDFNLMGKDTEEMFSSVLKKLLEAKEEPGLKDKIYSVDKKVNKLEREIRKRIVEHLSLRPSVDVPASLLMMSVVKDSERIGDYCKNLYEVTELLEKPLDIGKFRKLFNNLDGEIMDEFNKTRNAFKDSDEEMARDVLNIELSVVKRCDEILKELSSSNLSTNEAVCYTLIARYFKRIAAHLANIGTSVILPVSDLDFFDERERREKNK